MKEFLSRQGVPYNINLLTDESNRHDAARYGTGPSPLTLVGGEALFGFDRPRLLAALEQAGLLTGTSGDGQAAAAGLRFEPKAPLSEAVAVANFLGDSVTFLHPSSGGYLGSSLERSSIPVSGRPIAVEACPLWGTLAVVNYEGGTVTFLAVEDGAYLGGTLHRATRETGELPLYAIAHHEEPLLYVSNSESRSLTVFDPRIGEYAFGSREASTAPLQGQPGVMALHRSEDLLYVRLREGAVTVLDARTLKPAWGDVDASTFRTGAGRGIVLSADQRVVHIPEALGSGDGLALFDALTGKPLFGDRETSTLPTAPTPFAIAAHPAKPIVYVSCFGTQTLELRDAATGQYLHGDAERSSVKVGGGARAILVDDAHDIVYVTCFDEGAVYMLDALTGEPRRGDGGGFVLPLPKGPRGMALLR